MSNHHIASLAGIAIGLSVPLVHGQTATLPGGDGRQEVEETCTACHDTRRIAASSGYTREGWEELIGAMVDLSDRPQLRAAILQYLARHYPPHDRRAPERVAGDTEIAFREWTVPTPGQRPRDPVEAADGAIWWAGQWGNLLGRIDPVTGEMREYPLPPMAMPHSVTLDDAGNAWYTGNRNGTVGRLDPRTGRVVEYRMPDAEARDPHTAVFDGNGILWFTLQQSNKVGRLEPASGEIRLVTMKTPGARPYGIVIDARGAPWVACNGSNCLVRVDPRTMELTEIRLPDPASTVRRLDIADDGVIWYVNSSRGRLGRFDPETGAITEWPSPSGPDAHPYALAVVDGVVWYNESGKRPDTLIRFDPQSETFQSWPIPSGNIYAGIVRHMRPTRDGGLLIHQTGTNRIIRVTPRPPPR